MRIRVLGGGWYGCHIALAMMKEGHEVELHETREALFYGASGCNPARLHLGFHYPRSKVTRAACQEHNALFMKTYGHLTRGILANVYAIAKDDSVVDFGNYCQSLESELEFVRIDKPSEFGLINVEGALLTGERHIVIEEARKYFTDALGDAAKLSMDGNDSASGWDLTIDCTFCANDSQGIDRYEPCATGLLEGPTNQAVTIMDGPFPSIYPWNEARGLSSLTSAKFTPLARTKTWEEASAILQKCKYNEMRKRADEMLEQISFYWPVAGALFRVVDVCLSIRAMPRSGADARLVDVVKIDDKTLRVRAGKIDAIFHAVTLIKEQMQCLQ